MRAARDGATGDDVGAGDRARDPRPALHQDEDVLRLRALLRRRAERAHLPDLPRAPGQRCRSSTSRRSGTRSRSRLALGCEIAPRSIFHRKNYFYPDNSEGLPDQPVRPAPCGQRPARRRPHPPRPPGGGRGEARPRRRVGPDPRLRRLAGRLQPRRHAAGRDRHRARPARRREAREWAAAAADDDPPARRLRREHGGGQPALSTPTSRCARPARTSSAPRPSSRT